MIEILVAAALVALLAFVVAALVGYLFASRGY